MFNANNLPRIRIPQPDRAEELMNLPKLDKDDSFAFGCNQCGCCCREREDILLTPMDLYKIAKHLNKTVADVIHDYCEFYEGNISKIPVVRIKPREYRRTCPFSDKGRCIVHAVKPAVCALFPLGRMTNGETGEFTYFLQPVPCGNKKQTQTVREWLNEFSILDEEDFTKTWHKNVGVVAEIMINLCKKFSFNRDEITQMLFLLWYVRYDLDKEFLPQFTENCEIALRFAEGVKEKAENAV